ncbi:MAG: hypothetical protein ABW127_13580 [Candidatus Thiodiazotropha endolucinida]
MDSSAWTSGRLTPDAVVEMGDVCLERGSVALMWTDKSGAHAQLTALARVKKDRVSETVPRGSVG